MMGNSVFKFDSELGFGKYQSSSLEEQHHEAAYDAYITGVAFT